MSLPLLAPVSGLEIRLGLTAGTLSGADLARAEAALGDVSALIRDEARTNWIDPTDPTAVVTPDQVVTVVYQAVQRKYGNPDDLIQENLGRDYASARSTVGIYLTDEEKRIVRRAAAGGSTYDTRTPSAYFDPTAFGTADPGLYFWGLE